NRRVPMTSLEHGQNVRARRAVSSLHTAFIAARRLVFPSLARLDQLPQLQRLAVLWVVGGVALAIVTLVCFWLGFNFASAAFAFLIVIVVLSLLDSFISSAIFSVIGLACLNFFFVEPLFTFEVLDAHDVIALLAFLITSLAVTSLVRRVRNL